MKGYKTRHLVAVVLLTLTCGSRLFLHDWHSVVLSTSAFESCQHRWQARSISWSQLWRVSSSTYTWSEVLLYLWVGVIRARFGKFSFNICKVQLMVRCFKYFDHQTLLSQAVVSFLTVKCCARDTLLARLWGTVKIVQVSLSPSMFAECPSICFLNVPVSRIINAAYSVSVLSFSSILGCFHKDSHSEFWPVS